MLDVVWTGSYPNLCFGEWVIRYNGKTLNLETDLQTRNMGTRGEYRYWYFNADYDEIWESYSDGLSKEDWLRENEEWLTSLFEDNQIPKTDRNLSELYYKIQKEDWRHSSCGGCI